MVILAALLGWLGGALVNYLADVLPWKRRLAPPFCLACDRNQPWVNYLLWPRRCGDCGVARTNRAWLVEIFFLGAGVFLWYFPPYRLGFAAGLLLLVYFGVVTVIDFEHRLILHPVSIAGAGLGFALGVTMLSPGRGLAGAALSSTLGGLIGYGSMAALYFIGDLFVRWAARRRGETQIETALGFGDVNLSGVIGLLLGHQLVGLGLLIAILLGGAFSLVYLVVMALRRRYQLFTALPYGPYLVAGAAILIYFRSWLLLGLQ